MRERTRESIRRRAKRRCGYWRLPDEAERWPFHVEHIVARQHGGNDRLENLCWACNRCNLRKGTNLSSIDPETGQRAEIFDPRRHRWAEHFVVRGARIIGLTPSGRFAVGFLQINDQRRVELRQELIAE